MVTGKGNYEALKVFLKNVQLPEINSQNQVHLYIVLCSTIKDGMKETKHGMKHTWDERKNVRTILAAGLGDSESLYHYGCIYY